MPKQRGGDRSTFIIVGVVVIIVIAIVLGVLGALGYFSKNSGGATRSSPVNPMKPHATGFNPSSNIPFDPHATGFNPLHPTPSYLLPILSGFTTDNGLGVGYVGYSPHIPESDIKAIVANIMVDNDTLFTGNLNSNYGFIPLAISSKSHVSMDDYIYILTGQLGPHTAQAWLVDTRTGAKSNTFTFNYTET